MSENYIKCPDCTRVHRLGYCNKPVSYREKTKVQTIEEPEPTEQERRDIEVGEAVYYQADTTAITVYREQCEAAARADERAKVLAEVEAKAKEMTVRPTGMHTNLSKEQAPPSFPYWVRILIERL